MPSRFILAVFLKHFKRGSLHSSPSVKASRQFTKVTQYCFDGRPAVSRSFRELTGNLSLPVSFRKLSFRCCVMEIIHNTCIKRLIIAPRVIKLLV